MGGGWRIGRVAGISVSIHPSWLVIALLVTYSLAASQFPESFPGWRQQEYWVVGAATALLFFASVLAHEISHALVARRFGLAVDGITLFIFGGATQLGGEAARPRDEALIAVVGPLTSLVLGGALLAGDFVVDQPQVGALLGWLGGINLALGAFNLLPGFPMDGGRILRALLWRMRGERLVATRLAAAVGRFFGWGLILGGVFLSLSGQGVVGGIWLALIGWFLTNAAQATAREAGIEGTLRGVKVRDVMDASPPSVSPNESVAELVGERMLRGEDRSFLVQYDDGGLAGIVTLSDVRRLPREQWENARVTDIMTRFADLALVTPDQPLDTALKLLQEREVGQLPVVEEGRNPVGLLTRVGILRLIDTRLKLGV